MEVDGQERLGARSNDPPRDALAAVSDSDIGTLLPQK